MRRYLAFCLVLLLALSSAAHAEPAAAPAAPEAGYVLVARLEADGSYSYALLGEGDGAEAFAAFAGATYEERFAAFMEAVSKLEPALSFEGGEEVLTFAPGFGADGEAVAVSLGDEALSALAGKVAFAIVTGSFASGNPVLSGGCEVFIWTLEGILRFGEGAAEGEPQSLCENCGGIDDGSKEHGEIISKFCKEGHTKCMGDPEHYCDPDDGGCGRAYPCSKSNSHTKCAKCGKLWCYKKHGDHKELKCGHRGCEVYGEEGKHAKCVACGKYLCDGKDHAPAACGVHHLSEPGDHGAAACGIDGHFNCDGLNHSEMSCGFHYACDGLNHSIADCGLHYACESGNHAAALCLVSGHFNCDGLNHSEMPCGAHYACDGLNHSIADCGLHYVCEGGDHSKCEYCEEYLCNGLPHGAGICDLPV